MSYTPVIRLYNENDKEKLIEILNLNIPKFFDKKEIEDYKNYKKNGSTYLTIEHGNRIVGGTGYYVNEIDKSGRITWIFLTLNILIKDLEVHW